MTVPFRRQLVVVLVLTGTGFASWILFLAVMWRPADGARLTLQGAVLSIEAELHAIAQTYNAADVLVHRDASGRFFVSGRALPHRVEVRSIDELRALLATLPRPGIGLVTVEYRPGQGGIQGLLQPVPARVGDLQQEIRAVLDEAGFPEPPHSVKSLFPLTERPR